MNNVCLFVECCIHEYCRIILITTIRWHPIIYDTCNLKGSNANFCQFSFSYINANSLLHQDVNDVCVVDDYCIHECCQIILITAIRRSSIIQDATTLLKVIMKTSVNSLFHTLTSKPSAPGREQRLCYFYCCIHEYHQIIFIKAISVFVDMSQEPSSQLCSNNYLINLTDSSLFWHFVRIFPV